MPRLKFGVRAARPRQEPSLSFLFLSSSEGHGLPYEADPTSPQPMTAGQCQSRGRAVALPPARPQGTCGSPPPPGSRPAPHRGTPTPTSGWRVCSSSRQARRPANAPEQTPDAASAAPSVSRARRRPWRSPRGVRARQPSHGLRCACKNRGIVSRLPHSNSDGLSVPVKLGFLLCPAVPPAPACGLIVGGGGVRFQAVSTPGPRPGARGGQ